MATSSRKPAKVSYTRRYIITGGIALILVVAFIWDSIVVQHQTDTQDAALEAHLSNVYAAAQSYYSQHNSFTSTAVMVSVLASADPAIKLYPFQEPT